MDREFEKVYGNKVRVRACGICCQHDTILLVNHNSLADDNFWACPGGGVEFGESLATTLQREFAEETGLVVTVKDFQFGCEYRHEPLHAVELYFHVDVIGGSLKVGQDPELPIIKDARYFTIEEIKTLKNSELHGIFKMVSRLDDFQHLTGFYTI